MKMKQTMKRLLACTLAVAMLLSIAPIRAGAKTNVLHTVFSQKQVNDRIDVIRNYYYNKPKQLTVRQQKVRLNSGTFTISDYVHGKDLMFGYGVNGKTEYRLYFYKNQQIQLLVDAPGKSRKTFTQLYKKMEPGFDDEDLYVYMQLENYARKEMDNYSSPKNQILEDQAIMITKVSGNTIIYHKLNCYGPDGYIGSIEKKAYKAKLKSNVTIEDYSDNPYTPTYRNLSWLKKQVSSPNLGLEVDLKKDGNKISKIRVMYFP